MARANPASAAAPPRTLRVDGGLQTASQGRASRVPDTTRVTQFPTYYGQRPMFGWGLQEALGAVQQHVTGNFATSGRLARDMAQNAWLHAALRQRLDVETECPTVFTPAGRTQDEVRRAKRCRDFCKEVYQHVLPLHTRLMLHRDRIMMGQAVFGIDWEEVRDGRDRWWLPFVKPWDPTLTSYLYGLGDDSTVDGGSYCATTLSHGLVRVKPGDGRWGLIRNDLKDSWFNSVVYSLAAEYVGDGYNFRDNQDHQDRWGRGILTVEYPVGMPQNEIAALLQSANDGGGGGVLPLLQVDKERPTKAALLRADGAGWQTFDHTETRILRRMMVRICGNDMALVGQTGIAENDPRTDMIWKFYAADAVAATDCQVGVLPDERTGKNVKVCMPADGPLRQQIFSWVAAYNFGSADLAPYIWLDATEMEDYDRQQDAAAGRAQKVGAAFASVSTAVKNGLFSADDAAWALEQCGLSMWRPPEDGRRGGVSGADGGAGGASPRSGAQRRVPTVAEREARLRLRSVGGE